MPVVFKKAKKKNLNIAILLIDVNDFKKINDKNGHDYGDYVLEEISKILQNSFGQKDIIARWGGDEFLIISIFSNYEQVLEKINLFEHTATSKSWKKVNPVSVSIGKSIFPNDGMDLNELIKIADFNMYEIKRKKKEQSNFK